MKSPRILQNYPDGLLGFVLNRKFDAKSIVADATNLLTKATERYVMDHGMTSFKRSCKQFRYAEDEAVENGMQLYRSVVGAFLSCDHYSCRYLGYCDSYTAVCVCVCVYGCARVRAFVCVCYKK